MNIRSRLGLALLTVLATGGIYAEGVLKTGWIEVLLLVPVGLFLITKGLTAKVWQNVLISIIASSLTVVALDIALRHILGRQLHYTPTNVLAHKLPQLPIVGRYDPNVSEEAEAYGDLAAMAGNPDLREPRRISFQTDQYGFRNHAEQSVFDLLVVGDSFAVGGGTTGKDIFARLLETQYGYRTYNLSFPGGPYEQFLNVAIEAPRLKFAPNAKMIWTIYTGNDLADAGGEIWDLDQLPWRQGFSAWLVTYRTYRNRSPLNQWMEAIRMRLAGSSDDVIVRRLPDGRSVLFLRGQEAWGKRSRKEVEAYPNFSKLERTLASMQDLTAKRNIEVTILILPTKGEVYRWLLDMKEPRFDNTDSSGFALAVLGACEKIKLSCHDTKPYLIAEAKRLNESSQELLWWRDDTHIGKHGHAAIAAYIARDILKR